MSSIMIFILSDYNEIHKKRKFSAFDMVESRVELRFVWHVTWVDTIVLSFFNSMINIFILTCVEPET